MAMRRTAVGKENQTNPRPSQIPKPVRPTLKFEEKAGAPIQISPPKNEKEFELLIAGTGKLTIATWDQYVHWMVANKQPQEKLLMVLDRAIQTFRPLPEMKQNVTYLTFWIRFVRIL